MVHALFLLQLAVIAATTIMYLVTTMKTKTANTFSFVVVVLPVVGIGIGGVFVVEKGGDAEESPLLSRYYFIAADFVIIRQDSAFSMASIRCWCRDMAAARRSEHCC